MKRLWKSAPVWLTAKGLATWLMCTDIGLGEALDMAQKVTTARWSVRSQARGLQFSFLGCCLGVCTGQALALKPRILVAAPSNAAVDAIMHRLMEVGFLDATVRRSVEQLSPLAHKTGRACACPRACVVCLCLCARLCLLCQRSSGGGITRFGSWGTGKEGLLF